MVLLVPVLGLLPWVATCRGFSLPINPTAKPPLAVAAPAPASARQIVADAAERLRSQWWEVDGQTKKSMSRVLTAFREAGVAPHHFGGVDGYGHGDLGRDALDEVVAKLMGAEAALVRVQCYSGTHAIACALFGVLRPGDTMLACSGAPYDTLEEVIGSRLPEPSDGERVPPPEGLVGSLKEFHIDYKEVPLGADGTFLLESIDRALEADPSIKVLHVQRSCGYQWRPSIPIAEIQRFCEHIRARDPERRLVIFVDNCYGEFVEDLEPPAVGADLIAGSFIKNPGGTIARSGGYVAGRAHLVSAAANRLAAPGVGGGATLGQNKWLFQGIFLASSVVGESIKGAQLLAEVFASFGMETNPAARSHRTDIVQSIKLGSRDRVLRFCEVVQRLSPVSADCRPIPGASAGYGDEVIFADGTFVEGSTLELSADGPLREPFAVYAQGCVHWSHWALILEEVLVEMGLAPRE